MPADAGRGSLRLDLTCRRVAGVVRRLEKPGHAPLVPARTAGHGDVTEAAAALVRLEGRAAAAGSPADFRLPGAYVVAERAAPGPVIEHLYRHEVVMPAPAAAESPGPAQRESGQPAGACRSCVPVSPEPCRAPGGMASAPRSAASFPGRGDELAVYVLLLRALSIGCRCQGEVLLEGLPPALAAAYPQAEFRPADFRFCGEDG